MSSFCDEVAAKFNLYIGLFLVKLITSQKRLMMSFKLNIRKKYAQILESDFEKSSNWKTSRYQIGKLLAT